MVTKPTANTRRMQGSPTTLSSLLIRSNFKTCLQTWQMRISVFPHRVLRRVVVTPPRRSSVLGAWSPRTATATADDEPNLVRPRHVCDPKSQMHQKNMFSGPILSRQNELG